MVIPEFIPFGGSEIEPSELASAEIVVLPLCYENAISYGTGTRTGPLHLLAASEQLERMDEETFTDWGTLSIHTMAPVHPSDDPDRAVAQMKRMAEPPMAAGQRLLCLGGDHAISIGPIQAAAERHAGLGVLQIDAHLDLRESWNGSRNNHACVMKRVIGDLGLPAAQVGIRSFSKEEAEYIRDRNISPFYAHELDPADDSWMDAVVDALPEKVYITLDLDGLDPSVIPGTGTPEPGGLTYRQVIRLLSRVGSAREVVAADINELSTISGTFVSEFTAAKLATKIFVHCFAAHTA